MLSFVVRILRPYWKHLVVVLLAMLVETLMGLAAPWPLKLALDNVLGSHPLPEWLSIIHESFLGEGKNAILHFAALAVVAIAVLDGISSYADSYFTTSIGQWIAHDLRRTVYDHLQRLSLSYYDRHDTGNLISTITEDIDAVQSFASSSMLNILVDVFTVIGMLAVMFYLEWDFTLIALSVTPLLAILVYRFKHVVKRASHEVRKKQSEIVSVVQEGLASIRVVKAFARGEYEEGRLREKSLESVSAALRARRVKSLLPPLVSTVVSIGTALVLLYGTKLVLAGQMTAGSLVVFLAYLSRLFKPIQDLAKMANNVAQAAVGLERIKAIIDTNEKTPELPGAREAENINGEVEFCNVTFGYDPNRLTLKDVSFSIPPGKMVGIVGATGGGKSTIISLIPRFYDPVSGQVKLDGTDVRDFTLKSLREQISCVLQDTQLFRAPIWQNIAYGKPGATREEIIRAATLANAHEFIGKMGEGYDTMLGERGMTLSGGQRQRIGIARAIIRDTPVLLLDEPTTGLDAESERVVLEALERLMKGRTTIVIAHRLVGVRNADLIIVVKDGTIAESGTHDELLACGGLYAGFYEIQSRATDTPSFAKERMELWTTGSEN
jgi:ABC-type multidrug transport system fused ATPase/permease subunit